MRVDATLPIVSDSASCVLLTGRGAGARLLLRSTGGFWTHFVAPVAAGQPAWAPVWQQVRSHIGSALATLYTAEYLERYFDLTSETIVLTPAFVVRVVDRTPDEEGQRWCTLDEAIDITPHPNQHALYRHVWAYFVTRRPSEAMRVRGPLHA